MKKIFHFLGWPIVAGAFAAIMLLQYNNQQSNNQQEASVSTGSEQQTSTPPSPTSIGPVSYADAVKKAQPAVVNIYTRTIIKQREHPMMQDPFFQFFFNKQNQPNRERIESSLGSGVILSSQGYVLTNHHVIAGADEIVVALQDGRESRASIIGSDPDTDLAVIKIGLENLPSITIKNRDSSQVGDVVLAIGNPFGVGQTVTMGIVSATGRSHLGINTFENFIQTDAAINPGNSGGALINAHGQLIGINTAIYSQSGGSQGIGFAIPTSIATNIMKEIIEHGKVIRGWLGVEMQDISPALAKSYNLDNIQGVIIYKIVQGGPAHTAGLVPGDIITQINRQAIINGNDAIKRITDIKPGSHVNLTVIRQQQEINKDVIVSQRPDSTG